MVELSSVVPCTTDATLKVKNPAGREVMTIRGRGGPTPYLTLDLAVKADQGAEAHRLHTAGFTFAEVAERLGCR